MPNSKGLLRELRDALAHLDDPLYLEDHKLGQRLPFVTASATVSRGQALRRTLRLAIESLDPGPGVPVNAPEARVYQVLYRYAIARQGMVAIAAELNISDRQAYRELRKALASLAGALFPEEPVLPPLDAGARSRAARVREEVERLSAEESQELDLSELLIAVVESARPLAGERGVSIRLMDEAPGPRVTANRIMLRQALLNLVSHMVSSPAGDEIVVHLYRGESEALIQFRGLAVIPGPPPSRPTDPYAVAVHLFAALGLPWEHVPTEDDGAGRVEVRIPLTRERCLLIVDDNQGLVTLFRRYLRGQPYRVHEANTASRALEMIAGLQPEGVLLDVMMPGRDGWEVLQALRARDPERRTRIIICSIIDDPQLAMALGADAFLHKPVDRTQLLQTLSRVMSPAQEASC